MRVNAQEVFVAAAHGYLALLQRFVVALLIDVPSCFLEVHHEDFVCFGSQTNQEIHWPDIAVHQLL